jgi:predicted GTPase
MVERVIIMGAAGRDFHNFNVYFRNNPKYHVIAFTAAQIPNIEGRIYPAELAGGFYPHGIPIYPEDELPKLIGEHKIDLVVFSYSDIPQIEVMHRASIATAEGADFILLGATYTMLKSEKPVIAVCAVRTGCGKSQTTRKVCEILTGMGKKVVVVRHPMPYGDLSKQAVQRFSSLEDLVRNQCTMEEREEFEPLINQGIVVYAGVDYGWILHQAESESDIIIWDGGNNDTPFYHPKIHIVLFDPHRAGHELLYYPSETNMRMADVAIINKVDSGPQEGIDQIRKNLERYAPEADVVLAESPIFVDDPGDIEGKRVLVIEDGPTLTHGNMAFGAGVLAAKKFGASVLIDPRSRAVGSIKQVYERYTHIGPLLPNMGYGEGQIRDLEKSINAVDCDLVLFATPVNLKNLLRVEKPMVRVRYEYKDAGSPTLKEVIIRRLSRKEMEWRA